MYSFHKHGKNTFGLNQQGNIVYLQRIKNAV